MIPYKCVELRQERTEREEKDVFCDLRVMVKNMFVDIDVTVVVPESVEAAFNDKMHKHLNRILNNTLVRVLPLVFDTFGTIYEPSL